MLLLNSRKALHSQFEPQRIALAPFVTGGIFANRVTLERTAGSAAIRGVTLAGKTGTAEIGSDEGLNDSWFTGFAPADDPRFLVYVVVQDPKNGGGGGSVGGPAFRKIMTYLLRRYAVPPTGAPAPDNPVEW